MNSKTKMLLLVAVCSISLFSCRKDYSCECTISYDAGLGTPISLTQSTKIEKTSKKGAEGTCDNIESNLGTVVLLAGGTLSCTID